ncbi:MAG: NAD(P)H-binding protein [Bacteroidota bacterium]|nr:NAD(P)H-binding protein [Bacteroidota bacterium]
MKFIITGSTGNISKPLSEQLIKAGHEVSIITSNSGKTAEIEAIGAKALVGSVEDAAFLTKAFEDADAVYTMIPPKMDAVSWQDFIYKVGENYATAIRTAGIRKVVNLSAIGAHMVEGGGLVSLYHYVEQQLNHLERADVVHLRPGSFYINFFGNIDMIKHMGIIGNNYADITVPMVHPRDIAATAFEELSTLDFKGKTSRYVVSDERPTAEIAKVLGEAIGKPELQWVKFSDDDALNGMVQAGLTLDVAQNLVQMGRAVASGASMVDYLKHKPTFGPTKLEDFAKEFAVAYANS